MAELIELGALWEGTDSKGNPMLSGTINGNVRVLVLKNTYKEKDNQPDFKLYITKNERRDDSNTSQGSDAPADILF